MYGTVADLRIKPGHEEAIRGVMEEQDRIAPPVRLSVSPPSMLTALTTITMPLGRHAPSGTSS